VFRYWTCVSVDTTPTLIITLNCVIFKNIIGIDVLMSALCSMSVLHWLQCHLTGNEFNVVIALTTRLIKIEGL
jgi:hypothetical protein